MQLTTNRLTEAVHGAAIPLTGGASDHDPLLDLIGDATIVLLGEASHGTHEFYHERAEITRRLIDQKGFTAVVVEADWPDAYRINRFVRGDTDDDDPLGGFLRFPAWMWRNTVVRDFVHWLREHNERLPAMRRTGFYGMDLYSLFASVEAVLRYLDGVDPDAALLARRRYACFEHFAEDSQRYGYAAAAGIIESCEDAVIQQLVELRRREAELSAGSARSSDEYFFAEQNARLVLNAERYYRSMFRGRESSWNLRDRHMTETIEALAAHLRERGVAAKIVVWAHNSHLGDARATQMGRDGELNVGQLVRERWGASAVLVGFTTHRGTVTAANDWDDPPHLMRVRPSLEDSHEAVFHDTGVPSFMLPLRDAARARHALRQSRLERAIGVIYRPRTERVSHYFQAWLPQQFDAVIHIDETRALEPLEPGGAWTEVEVPETYPSGL